MSGDETETPTGEERKTAEAEAEPDLEFEELEQVVKLEDDATVDDSSSIPERLIALNALENWEEFLKKNVLQISVISMTNNKNNEQLFVK